MSAVKKQVEITVHVSNDPASMGRLMATTASCGVEVLAACSYYSYDGGIVMLVTDDAARTMHALEHAGFKCKADSVLLVEIPNKPGIGTLLGAKLTGAGIRILYSYSFRSANDQGYIVFKTTDDHRAFYLLEVESLVHELAAAKSWRRFAEVRLDEQEAEPQAA
jgi:hypothetical protein